jgi:hypothetical protein
MPRTEDASLLLTLDRLARQYHTEKQHAPYAEWTLCQSSWCGDMRAVLAEISELASRDMLTARGLLREWLAMHYEAEDPPQASLWDRTARFVDLPEELRRERK